MRAHEFISEVGYAAQLPELKLTKEHTSNAEVVGQIDGSKIQVIHDLHHDIYFINSDSGIAYAAISNTKENGFYTLSAIENPTNIKGLASQLVIFLTTIDSKKLVINAVDRLTENGISWLIKLIQSGGRGLKVKSEAGSIDVSEIYKEWEASRLDDNFSCGPTTIFIENKNISKAMLESMNTKWNNSSLIKPLHLYRGDERLL